MDLSCVLNICKTLSLKEKMGSFHKIFHKVKIQCNVKGRLCFRSEKWKTSKMVLEMLGFRPPLKYAKSIRPFGSS